VANDKQPLALMPVSDQPELVDHGLAPVENCGSVDALVRVDPDGEQIASSASSSSGVAAGGTILMRVGARACFEPRHGENPAAGHFVITPTRRRTGHS
jgi:hypothetical protein